MTLSPNREAGPVAAATVEKDLLEFLAARTKATWGIDEDLFASGAVSSLFAMELVVHLEQTFGITVVGPDLMMDNFRTIRSMTELVGRLGTGDGNG